MSWELVSGLETHVELSTNTKIFCGCTTKFGGEPNTNCCPICIGLPGTLPKLNRQVVHYAIMAGLATHCTINNISKIGPEKLRLPRPAQGLPDQPVRQAPVRARLHPTGQRPEDRHHPDSH